MFSGYTENEYYFKVYCNTLLDYPIVLVLYSTVTDSKVFLTLAEYSAKLFENYILNERFFM